jgi:hypothetical protein
MTSMMRSLALAAASLALVTAARADPPTTVLTTQTVQTLTAATDAALTGTGPGIRMLCVQNIGTGLVTLNFDALAVAGQGWALNAAGGAGQAGGSICWYADTVPRSVVHAISTAGSVVAVLVGK